jgi:hypothetical protein
MNAVGMLSDYDHPMVQSTASQLTSSNMSQIEKLEAIFHFVRDKIKFGFPPKWDEVKASETLQYKVGTCNTKATLFVALCKVADIPARIHAALTLIRQFFRAGNALRDPIEIMAGARQAKNAVAFKKKCEKCILDLTTFSRALKTSPGPNREYPCEPHNGPPSTLLRLRRPRSPFASPSPLTSLHRPS